MSAYDRRQTQISQSKTDPMELIDNFFYRVSKLTNDIRNVQVDG